VCQRTVDEIGKDGFDDRVASVGEVGLRGRFGVVGGRSLTPFVHGSRAKKRIIRPVISRDA
jgi:hypothetical protein